MSAKARIAATSAGIILLFAMAAVAARYAARMIDVPPMAFMGGYLVGALSGCFAMRDWMHKTGQMKRKGKRT